MTLGQTAIEDIQLDASCRDDIPAVLRGVQHIDCHETLREKVFALLQEGFERAVGLSVLALNLHRIGLLLQRRERERLKRARQRRLRLAA